MLTMPSEGSSDSQLQCFIDGDDDALFRPLFLDMVGEASQFASQLQNDSEVSQSAIDWEVFNSQSVEAFGAFLGQIQDDDAELSAEDKALEASLWARDDGNFLETLEQNVNLRRLQFDREASDDIPFSASTDSLIFSGDPSPTLSRASTPMTSFDYTPGGTPEVSDIEKEKDNTNFDPQMPPPPVRSYPTWEALKTECQAWAKDHGYALVISRNDTKKPGGRLTLVCDRSKRNRKAKVSPDLLKRNITTRKCDCKFTIHGRLQANKRWKVLYC
jgi:hypothetical protein